MRDIVWLIRPGEETWQQMLTRFRETASKLLRTHEYTFVVHGEAHDDRLPLEFKRDIFLIYKEVLNNIVRHAGARQVTVSLSMSRQRVAVLRIADDGKGLDSRSPAGGPHSTSTVRNVTDPARLVFRPRAIQTCLMMTGSGAGRWRPSI